MTGIAALLAHLNGCDWGRRIGLPHDHAPCPEPAVQVTILHGAGEPRPYRLCTQHSAVVTRETDPHREVVAAD